MYNQFKRTLMIGNNNNNKLIMNNNLKEIYC